MYARTFSAATRDVCRLRKPPSRCRKPVVTKTPSAALITHVASYLAFTIRDLPNHIAEDARDVTEVFSPKRLIHFVKPAAVKTGYSVSNPTLRLHGRAKASTTAPALKSYDLSVRALNVSNTPAISVIVPMYNAAAYIGECLDSLLIQTLQDFEVIIVDDCSTDNSVAVVESYAPKFNGRLRLERTEKNSGGGGYVPRNKGITIARGEYVQFLDADDMLTDTALEELYGLAIKWDAEVVFCEKFYKTDADGSNKRVNTYQAGKLVDKPTLETNDLKERVQRIIDNRYLTVPWNKLVRRDLIMENEHFFPIVKTSGDNIWGQGLIFYAKRFLRVPNVVNIYRQSQGSAQRAERTPQQHINFWLNPVLLGLKALDALMNRHAFFEENSSLRYALLKKFITTRFNWTLKSARELTKDVIYLTIQDEFDSKLGEYDILIPALCTVIYDEKKLVKLSLRFPISSNRI